MSGDIPFPEDSYRPEQIPFKDWPVAYLNRPINYPVFKERDHYLATVRGFDAGGFEATIRQVDAQAIADAQMLRRGVRKPVAERDERDMIRFGQAGQNNGAARCKANWLRSPAYRDNPRG